MRTVIIDVLNDDAYNLLKNLEALKIIRVRREKTEAEPVHSDLVAKYKGAMTKQPKAEIDQQLKYLRNG